MQQTPDGLRVWKLRTLPKDLGVALITLLALGLGWLLYTQVDGRTQAFATDGLPLRFNYPANWVEAQSLQDVLLKAEDPQADSAYKTTLTVETRELDPQSPPTLQALLDRRVEERSALTGYHFLANRDTQVAGARSIELEYAYVVQPIDTPRRASLPVVVQAREYIVVTQDRSYYLTLAAPQNEFAAASARFEQIIRTVQL